VGKAQKQNQQAGGTCQGIQSTESNSFDSNAGCDVHNRLPWFSHCSFFFLATHNDSHRQISRSPGASRIKSNRIWGRLNAAWMQCCCAHGLLLEALGHATPDQGKLVSSSSVAARPGTRLLSPIIWTVTLP
jgi:hypothetical protein